MIFSAMLSAPVRPYSPTYQGNHYDLLKWFSKTTERPLNGKTQADRCGREPLPAAVREMDSFKVWKSGHHLFM